MVCRRVEKWMRMKDFIWFVAIIKYPNTQMRNETKSKPEKARIFVESRIFLNHAYIILCIESIVISAIEP
jgi:hypothetical protein